MIKKPKKLTIEEYNAQIDKDTRKFSKLDKAGKRVMIAKDVIIQLDLNKLKAVAGAYIDIKIMSGYKDTFKKKDIKANYSKINECRVCALGACLMSVTRLNNKLKFSDVGGGLKDMNYTKVSELFKDIFTPNQLLLIETAFEGDTGGDKYAYRVMNATLNDNQFVKAVGFNDEYMFNGDDSLLRNIMLNIIKNKGTFKP